jgi:hypothetical protein
MQPRQQLYLDLLKEHGLEDSDERYFFWLAGLRSTVGQQPVAYGHFTASGELIQLTQFIDPQRLPVPLYAAPVSPVKPDIQQSVIEYVWKTHYQPDDLVGFARWIEKTAKA